MIVKRIVLISFVLMVAFGVFTLSGENPEAGGGAERVLYIFAHQDDEIGIAAKMAADLRAGRDVHAVWITDGAASTPADVREKESREGMKLIGVPRENLRFLGYTDNGSFRQVDRIYEEVMELARGLAPAEIVSIAYEGGNIDHDVTSLMAALAVRELGGGTVHYEFPLYNTYNSNYRMGKFIPCDEVETLYTEIDRELAELKLRVIDAYTSQAHILNMLKAMMTKKTLMRGEPYRVAPEYDYLKPPVEGTIGYEFSTRLPHTFDEWIEYVRPFLENLEKQEKEK